MEWDLRIPTLQNYALNMGFNRSVDVIAGAHGPIANFYNVNGSGNWLCQTDDGTTTDTVDSGVAIGTGKKRFRIEYHGANVDEASVERVLFFIDGAVVANMTSKMPSVSGSPSARPLFMYFNTAGGSSGAFHISPVRFCSNRSVDAF
jgi:hypothetical protein